MKKLICVLLALMPVFISCVKRDWTNPFSSDCPKEIWTPTNFSAVQEGTTVKLTWSQPINNISGFKIQKSVDGAATNPWQDQTKGTIQITDNNLTGGKVHLYSLSAFAGSNTSNTVTAQITPVLTAGITTLAVSAVGAATAQSGGTISSDGGAAITSRGVCWATTQNPTVAGSKTSDGTGTGSFASSMTGLSPGTTYYLRAYAINSVGTAYGNELSLTTSVTLPAITTTALSAITSTTALSGGSITTGGGATITARGVCWSTAQAPTIAGTKTTDGTGTGSFSSSISGLTPGKTYYVRAYAINSAGTAYGNEVTFTSSATAPTLTTTIISSIAATSATGGGTITNDGGAAIAARGVCWGTTANPTIANSKTTDGTGTGSFVSAITGLISGTTYYVRAYATNSTGTVYGNEVTFSSSAVIPTLTTTAISSITATSATSGGNITVDGGAAVSARGVCWGTISNPTITSSKTTDGTGAGSFSSTLTGLASSTTYYVRAYAINSVGTAYGNQVSFTTSATSGATVTDMDGNVYKTVTIGTQIWLAENLKTTKYSNNTSIPFVTDVTGGANLVTPRFCWYNNDAANKSIYGALYNWYAVNSDKLCPTGWHVPTDTEWTVLTTFLGGESVAGGQLKETGTNHWASPNTGATNTTGFSALPGGSRYYHGLFSDIGTFGLWWSSSEYTSTDAWLRDIGYNMSSVRRYYYTKQNWFSVRCVKTEFSLPTISTVSISNITSSSATSGGNISSDGGATIAERGVCWSTASNPTTSNNKTTNGSGTGVYISSLTGLAAGTTYYVRAYATNSVGTAYGNQVSFTTSAASGANVTDAEGNIYKTVTIGSQVWMAENLKTTKYNDNTTITLVTDSTWVNLATPGYCWYKNDAATYKNSYGALYNWFTVNTGKLCPVGWHVPSDSEWTTLTTFLGGETVAGGKLKETGTLHWFGPNTGATNSTGFSALPGGNRSEDGTFGGIGSAGSWWSSKENPPLGAWARNLTHLGSNVGYYAPGKLSGYSVRCLRDY